MYVFLQYLDRLTQFSLKLVKLWACPGTTFPTLCKKSVGSLMSPAKQYKVYAEDRAHVYRSYLRR